MTRTVTTMMMTTMVTTTPATTPPLPEEESPPVADVLLGGIGVPLPLVPRNVNKKFLVISSINGRWYQKAL